MCSTGTSCIMTRPNLNRRSNLGLKGFNKFDPSGVSIDKPMLKPTRSIPLVLTHSITFWLRILCFCYRLISRELAWNPPESSSYILHLSAPSSEAFRQSWFYRMTPAEVSQSSLLRNFGSRAEIARTLISASLHQTGSYHPAVGVSAHLKACYFHVVLTNKIHCVTVHAVMALWEKV